MKLYYFLTRIFLSGVAGLYRAQVQKQTVLTLEMLAKRMSEMNTSFSRSDIIGIFDLAKTCIKQAIREGMAVDTLIGMLKYSISGSFDSPDDSFDRSRHKIKANVTLYKEFLEEVEKIKVERVKPTEVGPSITLVTDGFDPNSDPDMLKIGGLAKVHGSDLRISPNEDGTSTDQGIYFIADDGTETQVAQIAINMPSELLFAVPATLVVGDYSLLVRTYEVSHRIGKNLLEEKYHNAIQVIAG